MMFRRWRARRRFLTTLATVPPFTPPPIAPWPMTNDTAGDLLEVLPDLIASATVMLDFAGDVLDADPRTPPDALELRRVALSMNYEAAAVEAAAALKRAHPIVDAVRLGVERFRDEQAT